jgi:hypothetical protein
MNIENRCDQSCGTDSGASTATVAGIQLVQKALDMLGHPEVVDYVDIADAFTPKIRDEPNPDIRGEPIHTEGHLKYLALGTDITCDCVLRRVLQQCGYTESDLKGGEYVRTPREGA